LGPHFLMLGAAEVQIFPDLPTILWTLLNFAIVLWALNKWLFKPLTGAIEAREREIEQAIQKAHEDRAEAERLRKEFEAQIASAHREAQEIINNATRAANATREQIENEARARAAEVLENATRTIEREKAKALAELREEVASLAIMVAGKVIEENLDDAKQRRLAERFVEEVGKH
jgi:F-type H+-transporting ATPase subunit b